MESASVFAPDITMPAPLTEEQKYMLQRLLDGANDEIRNAFTQFVEHLSTGKQADEESNNDFVFVRIFEQTLQGYASDNIRLVDMFPSDDEQQWFIGEMSYATAFDKAICRKDYLRRVERVEFHMIDYKELLHIEQHNLHYYGGRALFNIPSHKGPRYNMRMADALEHRPYVTELELNVRRFEDDPLETEFYDGRLHHFEKIFHFIRFSDTLKELLVTAGELSCESFLLGVFRAVSQRSKEFPCLKIREMSVRRLKTLRILFGLDPKVGELFLENWDEAVLDEVPPNLVDTFRNAGALAKIRNLSIGLDCPIFVLESFKDNPHFERVKVSCSGNDFRDPDIFARACLLFDSCGNATLKTTITLTDIQDWSIDLWLAFANSLKENDSVVELCLLHCIIELDNPGLVWRTLFAGKRRKLEVCGFSGIDIGSIHAIMATTQELSLTRLTWDDVTSFEALFSSLTTSSCVVQSLELHAKVHHQNEKIFFRHLPKFTSMKSLQIRFETWGCEQEEQTKEFFTGFKNKFFRALWKNRSLNKNVCIVEDKYASDKDRAFMESVVHRNRHLSGLLQPSGEMETNPALLPFLLKMSCETDLNECFGAIRCIPKISQALAPKVDFVVAIGEIEVVVAICGQERLFVNGALIPFNAGTTVHCKGCRANKKTKGNKYCRSRHRDLVLRDVEEWRVKLSQKEKEEIEEHSRGFKFDSLVG